jgi:hypothetical protein
MEGARRSHATSKLYWSTVEMRATAMMIFAAGGTQTASLNDRLTRMLRPTSRVEVVGGLDLVYELMRACLYH